MIYGSVRSGMPAYYNECDPHAASWLRELIEAGHIAPGVVDERSIEDVLPVDLVGYDQCHFFAGIGGWSRALRLAGWPDDKPVWTGSCPCQPFSSAGKRKKVADERHLWPAFKWLIDQRRPARVFGEQVAGPDGRGWLAGVRVDLEEMAYRVGAADLCAASVGAPHIRQRLYWVADGNCEGLEERERDARIQRQALGACEGQATVCGGADGRLVHAYGHGRPSGSDAATATGHWDSAIAAGCRDGKWRRIPAEPAFFPLADGVPARVVRLRGYGNAIVPELAASFVRAYQEAVAA